MSDLQLSLFPDDAESALIAAVRDRVGLTTYIKYLAEEEKEE